MLTCPHCQQVLESFALHLTTLEGTEETVTIPVWALIAHAGVREAIDCELARARRGDPNWGMTPPDAIDS